LPSEGRRLRLLPMNSGLRQKCVLLVPILASLAGCSRDPVQERAAFLSSARQYVKAEKYREAVIQFRNAIEIEPRSAEAHRELANVYLKLKDSQLAYRELLSTVELDPHDFGSQLQLATLYIAAHKYDDAQRTAEKVVAADPRNAQAHTVLGEMHTAEQAWPEAIREYQKAMELDPAAVANYSGLALAYTLTGRAPEAEATLKRAIEVQPNSIDLRLNLGRFYLMQHRLADAEMAMQAATAADPSAVQPRTMLAKIYLDAGKPAAAERVCTELKNRASDDPEAYGALASFYEATGQKEKAAAELQVLAASKPKDIDLKARLADLLVDLQRTAEAERLNQEVLSANPGNALALVSKGRLLLADQRFADARAALEQAVKSDGQSAAAEYYLGVAQVALGVSSMARASFSRALELAPGMSDAAVALADLDVQGGDYDTGLRLARQALDQNPGATTASVIAARALLAKGEAAQAEPLLRTALERDPANLPALGAMLDVESAQGKIKESVRRLNAVVAQHPQDARLQLLLGLACLKQNDLDRAESSVKQAIAIDPKTPNAYGVLAEIGRARGTLGPAIASYKAAIEQNPQKVENYMALSGLYEKQGNWEEAKRAAERAHAMDPGSPFIANNLAYLYLEHGGDLNMALSLAQQAKQKLPDSPIVSDTVGWAYYKLRSPAAAVAQLSESVRNAPGNAMYHYHLGMAYMAAGNPGNAARSLSKALAVSSDFPDAANARSALQQLERRTP